MFDSDHEVISQALLMWRNYIQTGDPAVSAGDAVRCGQRQLVKPLDSYQTQFILRLEELASSQAP
jgi:hypothetical protein